MTGGWFLIALTTLLNKAFLFWVCSTLRELFQCLGFETRFEKHPNGLYTPIKVRPFLTPVRPNDLTFGEGSKPMKLSYLGGITWNNHPLSSIFRVDPAYAKVLTQPFWAVRWITSCPMAVLAPPEDFSLNCPRDRERWSARWTYLGKAIGFQRATTHGL